MAGTRAADLYPSLAAAYPDLVFSGYDAADVATFSAQGQVIDLVLGLTSDLFEVGGSSAVTDRFALDYAAQLDT
jgi:hypothetical protein